MRANVKTLGAVTVVNLSGYISFESTEPFRNVCLKHLIDKEVIFDFSSLSFVGSCGIQDFLGVIREHRAAAATPARLSAVGPEFRRLMGLAQLHGIEMYPSEEMAILKVQPELVPLWVDPTPEDETLDEVTVSSEVLAEDLGLDPTLSTPEPMVLLPPDGDPN